jgi:hypothetical protein
MDWLKTTLDRLSGFLASLIPGSVLFLLFTIHQPDLIRTVWETPLLTYNTKVILSIFFSLLIGHTVNFALSSLLGGLGGALGGYFAAGPAGADPEVKPWQDKNWRAMLAKYLGRAAPENIHPFYKEVFEARMDAIKNYPEEERAEIAAKLLREKLAADLNDSEWRGWWSHLHQTSFFKRGPEALLHDKIISGFCSASLVVLIALPFTSEFRVWWAIAISIFWILYLVVRSTADIMALMNPWSSYTAQIEQLEEKLDVFDSAEKSRSQ